MNTFELLWVAILSIVGLFGIYLLYRYRHRGRHRSAEQTSTTKQSPTRIDQLRNDLLLKVLGDQAKAKRLIAFERQKTPTSSEAELVKAAIDRWERDNR